MTDIELVAACDRLLAVETDVRQMDQQSRDWFLKKPGHRDSFDVARALRAILTAVVPRKGPHMAESSEPRIDPQEQIGRWLAQYLDHVHAPEVKRQLNNAIVFRLARTMFEQGKTLDDIQGIIRGMAKAKTKPKSVGYLITVIEGSLGKVA